MLLEFLVGYTLAGITTGFSVAAGLNYHYGRAGRRSGVSENDEEYIVVLAMAFWPAVVPIVLTVWAADHAARWIRNTMYPLGVNRRLKAEREEQRSFQEKRELERILEELP